jgi:hypothetical protein
MGETFYYVEIDRNENLVSVEQRKGICRTCNGSGVMPQTNADRIRAMSDEKLAEFLDTITGMCWDNGRREEKLYCDECPMECPSGGCAEWLKQPAEDK